MKVFMKKIFVLLLVMLMLAVTSLAASGNKENAQGESTGAVSSASYDTISISWEILDSEIQFTLAGKTTGWIAVGFDPSQIMKGAQFVLGYVADGEVFIRDDFGSGMFTHAADTSLGGTDDIRLISGKEDNGWTEIVFALPIDSQDDFDVPLTIGEKHTVLLAHGPDGKDDFRTTHSFRTSFEAMF